MSAKRAKGSVTPRADKEAAEFRELDARIPQMTLYWGDMLKLKCKVCGNGPVMCCWTYAFSRDGSWRLITCKCPKKLVWVHLKM